MLMNGWVLKKWKFDKQIMSCRYPYSLDKFAFQLLDGSCVVVGCGPSNHWLKWLSSSGLPGDHKISLLSHYQHWEKERRKETQNTEKDREMGKETTQGGSYGGKERRREGRREGRWKTAGPNVKDVVGANGKFCFMKF